MASLLAISTLVAGCAQLSPDDGRTIARTSSSSGPHAQSSLHTDPSVVNKIVGIGVNANVHSWKGGQLKPAIDRFTALGPIIWRVIIDKGDWESSQVPGPADSVDWASYNKIYSSGKMADLWNTIRYIESAPGQTVSINVMGDVPDWMGGSRILQDKEDYWVRSMATMIAYGRNVEKLNFSLVGPMNEIDWNGVEGPQVGPDQYVRLMHKLITRLDSMGIQDIRLVAPDTADAGNGLDSYLPKIASDPLVAGSLAFWGLHTYSGDLSDAPSRLSSAGMSRPVVVTEFSGPCPGCDDGAPNPNDATTAIESARQAISLLEQGANGLQFYDAWDGFYEHHGHVGYWGALSFDSSNGTYSPRRTFSVLTVLARCVKPGAQTLHVQVGGLGADSAVGFIDPVTGKRSTLLLASDTGGVAKLTMAATPTTGHAVTVTVVNLRDQTPTETITEREEASDFFLDGHIDASSLYCISE